MKHKIKKIGSGGERMKEYSLSLIFEKSIEKNIKDLSKKIKFKNAEPFDNKSVPHCTLVKWKATSITDEQMKKLNQLIRPVEVIFSGITVLPSRNNEKNGGYWLEISILKTDQISDLVKKIVQIIGKENVLNEIGDLLRPHVTISRSYDKTFLLQDIKPDLLRKKVSATPKLGLAGKIFTFYG